MAIILWQLPDASGCEKRKWVLDVRQQSVQPAASSIHRRFSLPDTVPFRAAAATVEQIVKIIFPP